jgi:flagellar hook assembly protein FlgD
VRDIDKGVVPAGFHEFFWDGTNSAGTAVSSGVYFVRVQLPGTQLVRRAVVLR